MQTKIKGVAIDFDGTLSTGAVFINDIGEEMVQCHRSDSYGIHLLKENNIKVVVVTAETNNTIFYRCKKMDIHRVVCLRDPESKLDKVKHWSTEVHLNLSDLAFIGNDLNDLACIKHPDIYSFAVGDAHEIVKAESNHILVTAGGHGAVREACEIIINNNKKYV